MPWVPSYYTNTLVCYSYSKSLSLPGQRIGYVLVPRTAEDFDLVYAAVCGAGRALGYVCAPSLFQLVVANCAGQTADIAVYRKNRDLLLTALREMGYTCAQPEGAFYLMVTLPVDDAEKLQYFLLEEFQDNGETVMFAPGEGFYGTPGKGRDEVRLAYILKQADLRRAMEVLAHGIVAYNSRKL